MVLFAHGARDPRWALPLQRLKLALESCEPGLRVELAFLELQAPSLEQSLIELVRAGVDQISLVPVFWSLGGHVARDLPDQLTAFQGRHSGITIRVLPVISCLPGIDPFLVETFLALHRQTVTPHALTGPTAVAARFAVGPYLKEIGRGKKGSRGLARDAAATLMGAILRQELDPVALGGVLLALRMKGETADEIAGFLDAVQPHLARLPAVGRTWVVLPSYNGARSVANLVPLLAMMLARRGVPVLVHGLNTEPADAARPRVGTQAILRAMGIVAATGPDAVLDRIRGQMPVWMDLRQICPALAAVLALRSVTGVRNVGHTLAKLICPVSDPGLLIASYTHPEFGALQDTLFAMTGALAMSMRGTDGESVVSVKRTQAIDLWRSGGRQRVLEERSIDADPDCLPALDVPSTAAWTRSVLDGVLPVPAAVAAQLAAIIAVVGTGGAGGVAQV
jgi:anthranilate phosphoribosyltransferase